ncbi:MAG: hypothetical protein ACO3Z2_01230 [Chitinophagaceae bacterium]
MQFDIQLISLILSIIGIVVATLAFLNSRSKNNLPPSQPAFETTPLRLQAYERLVLLAERISLPQLINRLYQPGFSALEMKQILIENIRQEFEYNSTQQLYVSPIAWDAVKNLKEQEILFINQLFSSLSPNESAANFTRKILETEMAKPEGPLFEIVTQTLNREAKKLMST